MAKKYCEKCYLPVEMTDFECPSCSATSFVHSLPPTNLCGCDTPLINGFSCDRCRKKIDPSRRRMLIAKQTKTAVSPQALKAASNNPGPLSETLNPSSGRTIDDLIRAQNRTTHAVRAFVRFLFIQLSGITLAIFLWNLSTAFIDPQECLRYGSKCTGNTFLQFLAAVVMIVSVIWSSLAGWEELGKSNID